MLETQKILIYGYGNPGRQDDGLGNVFVDRFKDWCEENKLNNFEFDSNYQLNIEESEILTNYDIVLFIDASIEEHIDNFELTLVDEKNELSFTSHAASPSYIYMLGKKLFGKVATTYLLHIKGYSFEFLSGMTNEAENNLREALSYIQDAFIKKVDLAEIAMTSDRSTLS